MVAVSQATLGSLSLLFLAGSLVMLWLVILSGLTLTTPLRQTHFLRADTHDITGARPISQWTYFFVCGDGNADCGPAYPALPVGYAWSGDANNVPPELIGANGGATTSTRYWYMWRFGWVFYLLTLFFEVLAFGAGFLACCSRLGSALSGLIALAALVFFTVGVSLMTSTFIGMRNAFHAAGRDASVGTYAFGLSWGAWTALLISTVLLFVGTRRHRGPDAAMSGARSIHNSNRMSTGTRSGKSYEGRRVKEEYP